MTVRETNFGYIIHSARGDRDLELRRLMVRFGLVAVWVAVAALWIMPMNTLGLVAKLVLSGVLLAAAYAVRRLTENDAGGLELHVDTSRRELRSAVKTAKGESWIRNCARFNEVSAPIMRRSRPGSDRGGLYVRIAGDTEMMSVAFGDESTLLAVHDRLMRDLRPLEERVAGFREMPSRARSAGRLVFPPLGPEELTA